MFRNTRFSNLTLALLSGVLLSISFPHIGGLNLVVLIALVPLLILEQRLTELKSGWKVFGYSYLTFVLFNALTTWWIYFADPIGAVMAVLANALLMAITFWIFHFAKRNIGQNQGYIVFVFIWLAFEYQHYHWELSYPWLSLGNVFANTPILVQWYEWTGVLGGTFWIITINLFVYKILRNRYVHNMSWSSFRLLLIFVCTLTFAPITYSFVRYMTYEEEVNPVRIIIAQPNIDAYKEKFGPTMLPWRQQLDSISLNVNKVIDNKVDFIIAPETAIPYEIDEATFQQTVLNHYLDSAIQSWAGPDLIIGASTVRVFPKKNSHVSRKLSNGEFYESYNTSVQMSLNQPPRFVHKSKLVLGVEKVPFAASLPFLENFAMDMGGASGSLGVEKDIIVLNRKGVGFASLVCYESIYGEYVSQFVQKGAQILFVITNDGWWRDSPGYKQHFDFARLRAVETRRSIARSANTGISGFINQRGDVIQHSNWDEQTALKQDLNRNTKQTAYVKYGDFLGRTSWFVTLLIIVFSSVKFLRKFGSLTPYGGRQ
jgi:apolipoprotein N-acyltransferase